MVALHLPSMFACVGSHAHCCTHPLFTPPFFTHLPNDSVKELFVLCTPFAYLNHCTEGSPAAMDDDLEAAIDSIRAGVVPVVAEEEDDAAEDEWDLPVAKPVVTMVVGKYHLGVELDTERLVGVMWNVVWMGTKRAIEVTDRKGYFFTVFNSGKVIVSTTGSLAVRYGEAGLRKAARSMAHTIMTALKIDLETLPATSQLILPDPSKVKFLGYGITNIWASWNHSRLINITATLDNLRSPSLAQGVHTMYAQDGISLRVSLRDPLPRMVVQIKPTGHINFYGALDEASIMDVAPLIYDQLVWMPNTAA
eukprot:TRINITY_DN551_c0_g1_i2.p1 TRINITY_DN551_c0_g1~~TRINITY_DN551_c0_g1_i2.p1  ORF type:complete len:308 (+),score=55.57 TRINITY_DN551_c0_g1_i2:1355-2278(+)